MTQTNITIKFNQVESGKVIVSFFTVSGQLIDTAMAENIADTERVIKNNIESMEKIASRIMARVH